MLNFFLAIFICLSITRTDLFATIPAQIILLRHAEKPPTGSELDIKGRERAAALVPFFMGAPEMLEHGQPVAVFAQGMKHPQSSQRAIQTAQGIADAIQTPLQKEYTQDQYPEMIIKIRTSKEYDGKNVIICWEHFLIPDIAKALGVKDAPKDWPDDVFDRVWLITFDDKEAPTLRNLPQRLMYGDSSE